MQTFISSVPAWVSLAFIICFPIVVFMVGNLGYQAALRASMSAAKAQKIRISIIGSLIAWLVYTAILSFSGILATDAMPPRILLFTTLPLSIFLFWVVSRSSLYQTLLQQVSISSLIQVHIFRLVGIFFLLATYYDTLPASFAVHAGIGDILAALTSIWVAQKMKQTPTKQNYILALIWNIFGLLDILTVLVSAITHNKIALDHQLEGLAEIAKFPFCWIPALAPALIVFLHISTFKKLTLYKHSI